MLPVVFIVQNPVAYKIVTGWGFIVFLLVIGNYLMIRSFRRLWAAKLIKNHAKTVNKYIRKSLEDGDPWMVKLVMSNSALDINNAFYNCIWCYEKMIKDYSVWSLNKMVENKELFDRVYKK
jgi:hypothetical protein